MKLQHLLSFLLSVLGFAGAQHTPPATQVRIFTPFNANGLVIGLAVTAKVRGSCFSSSAASPERPDAWRCSAGNAIYDPCFENLLSDQGKQKVLACAEEPFSADVVLLTLTAKLPEPGVTGEPNFVKGLPWALELDNGEQCTLLTGASAAVAGLRVNYGCKGGAQVAGPVDRLLPLWRAFYQTATRSLSLDQVGVTTAWY